MRCGVDGAQLDISLVWNASNQDIQSIRQTLCSAEREAGWKKWCEREYLFLRTECTQNKVYFSHVANFYTFETL